MANESDPMKDMFDQARSQHGEKLQFTEPEAEKFKKAFDDPEFRKLFSEYMDEMQDPKNREENEAYIRQLEDEEKVPEGKELIRPTPCFVVKTHKKLDGEVKGDKIFINIVHSDKITKPIKTATKEGTSWSLPYCLGPPHMEKDKGGQNVACFDCCFHPDAVSQIGLHKQFRDSLVLTALEGVEEAYRRQKQDVPLSRDYHIVKGINYKDGQIPTLLIDVVSKNKEWDASKASDAVSKSTEVTGVPAAAAAAANSTPAPTSAAGTNNETSTTTKVAGGGTKSDADSGSGSSKTSSASSSLKKEPAIKKGFLNAASAKEAAASSATSKPSKGTSNSLIQEIPAGSRPAAQPAASSSSTSATGPSSSVNNNGNGSVNGKAESQAAQNEANALAAIGMKERTSKPVTVPAAAPASTDNIAAASGTTSASSTETQRQPPVTTVVENNINENDNENAKKKHPKYTLVERGEITLGDFENIRNRTATSRRPAELVIRLEIPLVAKASLIDLDVSERRLKFKYADVYDMEVALPYPVFDKKGGAKYDKSSKTLTVTLPVQPAPPVTEVYPTAGSDSVIVPGDSAWETPKIEAVAAQKQEDTAATAAAAVSTAASTPVKVVPPPAPEAEEKEKKLKSAIAPAAVSHSRWVGGSEADKLREESEKLAQELREKAEAAKKAAAAAAAALVAAQAPAPAAVPAVDTKARGLQPPAPQSIPPLPTEAASASRSNAVGEEEFTDDFYPSQSFQGPRKGYAFKLGDKGLGYYIDVPLHKKKTSTTTGAAAAATALPAANAATSAALAATSPPPSSFDYDFRETKYAVSLLVQVPGIVASSVSVSFSNSGGVDVRFDADPASVVKKEEDVNDDEKSLSKSKIELLLTKYAMGFDLAGKLKVSECKYDVASKNMVIVLIKEAEAYWAAGAAGGGDGGSGSTAEPVVKKRAYNIGKLNTTTPPSASVTITGTSNDSSSSTAKLSQSPVSAAPLSVKLDDLKSQLSSMQFSTGAAIFDLD